MPEYSSTPITPADSVKTPAMNGSTSGNYTLADLRAFILASKGLANGLASLDANGKLLTSQLPDLADDVLVYGSYALLPSPGTAGKLYITADDNKMYRWDADLATPAYVELSVDLSAYATKAELAAEESAREAEDTNLKNALQATNKRITNLEQKAGDELTITYPHVTYGMDEVPSNVAEYGKVTKLRGVTRGVNQYVYKDLATIKSINTTGTWSGNTYSMNNVTFTYDENTGKVTADTNGQAVTPASAIFILHESSSFINEGHKYIFGSGLSQEGSNSTFEVMITNFSANGVHLRNYLGAMVETAGSGISDELIQFVVRTNAVVSNVSANPYLTDLTQYFSSDPSVDVSTLTISDIQSDYPELLIPSDYDAGSLVSTTYSAVESSHKNLIDISRLGSYDIDGNGTMRIGVPIENMKADTYAVSFGGTAITLFLTTVKNGVYTSTQITGNSFTLSDFYPLVYIRSAYTNVNQWTITDLQVERGSTPTAYVPFGTLDTFSLSSPVTLRSAGSVHEELDVESGVKKRPIWSYTFTGNETWVDAPNFRQTVDLQGTIKPVVSNDVLANLICQVLVTVKAVDLYNGIVASGISVTSDARVRVGLNDVALLTGKTIVFEKATENPDEQLTPVLDPFLKVEGGGTIRPIQTQTTEIDSAMTAEYLSLGA